MTDSGVWAYAVLTAESAERRVRGLRGVAAEPVRVVTAGPLAAAVGDVPLSRFGETALRRNLEDLDWLGATARAHDAVISHLARSGPVLPLRMTTVYLTDSGVSDLLVQRLEEFTSALSAVTDRQELGVKAYADPKALGGEQAPPSGSRKASGTEYLRRRRHELSAQERAYQLASDAARRVHDTLSRYAVDAKRKPVSDQSLSGRTGWVVLNGTYLVDNSDAAEFRSAVSALNKDIPGLDLEVTGPWPPYSFAGDAVAS